MKDGQVYVLEANPRASRTVPFVAKATGVPLAMVAARVMVGQTLEQLRVEGLLPPGVVGRVPSLDHVSVKEAVLPFDRFPGVDTLLGPEMRSTGEVMGVDTTFGLAFAKSQMAAGTRLPDSGAVFLSLADRDKPAGLEVARSFSVLGFSLAATLGTAGYLRSHGLTVDTLVAKVGEEGVASDAVDLIAQGKVQLVVNTPRGLGPRADGQHIRRAAVTYHVPCLTTLAAARAAAEGRGGRARAIPSKCGRSRTCTSRTTPTRRCDEPAVWARHPDRTGRAAQPGHDGLGHLRARGGARGVRRPVPTRRGRGEVALGRAVAGQPRTARPRRRRGHAQQRRASRSRAGSVAQLATSRRWPRPGLGWW